MQKHNFWLYQVGQIISSFGDACGIIGLSWWVLEQTGSSTLFASTLASAMYARLFFLPLFGPCGDRYSRKWIVIWGDLLRGVIWLSLIFVYSKGIFYIWLIIGSNILLAITTAFFMSGSSAIIPELVVDDNLYDAVRHSKLVQSTASVISWLAAGVIVATIGIGSSFIINAFSFFFAAGFTCKIILLKKSKKQITEIKNPISQWFQDICEGVKFILETKLIFWIALSMMCINFILAPLKVILPVIIKLQSDLPASFYGVLQAGEGIGGIVCAVLLGKLSKRAPFDFLVLYGLCILGITTSLIPFGFSTYILPTILFFGAGFGRVMAMVTLNAQIALALPNSFRSRFETTLYSASQFIAPIGVMLGGILYEKIGVTSIFVGMGILSTICAIFLFKIEGFSNFMRLSPKNCSKFIVETYPNIKRFILS